MTASVANGFAQVLYEPDAASCTPAPVRVPPDVQHLERAHPRAVGGPHATTSRSRTRSGTSSTATLPTRDGNCTSRRSERPGRTGRRRRRLLQRGRLAARPDRGLPRHATTTSTGRRTGRTGLARDRTRPGQEVPLDSGHVHEPALQRQPELQPVAFETDLPRIEAADFGGRLQPGHRRAAASIRRRARASIRSTRPGARPVTTLARALCLAARRAGHQGNDEHVRRQLERRVRPPALQLLSGAEPGHARPDEQLQERAELEPLPRLRSSVLPRGAPSGALPTYPVLLGTTSSRTFDQRSRHGFSGRQSTSVALAESSTQ